MALWKISNFNKYDCVRSRILYRPNNSIFKINPHGFGRFMGISRFKYEYESHIPPSLANINGKLFISPGWVEVHPLTTLNDVYWVKPQPPEVKSKKSKKQEFKFESKSAPGSFYKVTVTDNKIKCNCSGYFRCKDKVKGCTHMQTVRKNLDI